MSKREGIALMVASLSLGATAVFGVIHDAQTAQAAQPEPVPVAQVQVNEDDPAWNCYTMGNDVCGDLPVAYIMPESEVDLVQVVVMDAANDGKLYGAEANGNVWPITAKDLEANVQVCIDTAMDEYDAEAAANCASMYTEVLDSALSY